MNKSYICENCGAKMTLSEDKSMAKCEYCNHTIYLDNRSDAEKEYERRSGLYKAEEEHEQREKKRLLKTKLLAVLIVFCIFAAFFGIGLISYLMIPKAKPFDYIAISFEGMNGEGVPKVSLKKEDSPFTIEEFYIDYSKKTGLSNGDQVKVTLTLKTTNYILKDNTKIFKVSGLLDCVHDAQKISPEAQKIIMDKSLTLFKNNTLIPDYIELSTIKRNGLYLRTDMKNNNFLFDVYEAHYNNQQGVQTVYIVAGYTNIYVKEDQSIYDIEEKVYGKVIWEMQGASTIMNIHGYHSIEELINDFHSSDEQNLTYSELKFS